MYALVPMRKFLSYCLGVVICILILVSVVTLFAWLMQMGLCTLFVVAALAVTSTCATSPWRLRKPVLFGLDLSRTRCLGMPT